MATAGMMDDQVMQESVHFFSGKDGHQTHTVLGRVGGKLGVNDIGAGRHDISKGDCLFTARAFPDAPGPAHDERHAMTSFISVGFPAAPVFIESHVAGLQLGKLRLG